MTCQIQFSGKKYEKNISKCCLLKILPKVQSNKQSTIFTLNIGTSLFLIISVLKFEKSPFHFLLMYQKLLDMKDTM